MSDMQFPAVLDATMFKSYKRCPRQFFHAHVEGKRLGGEDESVHLLAGRAFAKGLEAARGWFYSKSNDTTDSFHAIEMGLQALIDCYGPDRPAEAKNLSRLEEAFRAYFVRWPLSIDSGIVPELDGVESSFTFPIPGLAHPDTGEPMLYAGRRDMVGIDKDNVNPFDECAESLWMVDEKTGGYIKEGWQYAYELDWQFLGYMYHERFILKRPVEGVVIRKINLVRKVFDAKGDLAQARITFSDEVLKDWYHQMTETALEIEATYRLRRTNGNFHPNTFPQVFGDACNAFGRGCDFKPLCRHTTPPQYKIHRWDPRGVQEDE